MDSTADIGACLAVMPDHELHAMRTTIAGAPTIVPSLQAWLLTAIAWELSRRAGTERELLSPRATIGEADVECSLVALAILHASFRNMTRVAHFLDAIADSLCTVSDGPAAVVH